MNDHHPLFAGIGGHHSARAQTDEWLTPPHVLAALGGADAFDLDPATPDVQPWPTARQRYTRADNGLIKPWFGRVWLNPPYGAELLGWMRRMAAHDQGVALIFARTETEAFVETVWKQASAVLFLFGRLHFHLPDGRRAKANSGAPSVLCAYGPDDCDRLAECGLAGQFVPLRVPRGYIIAALDTSWREAVVGWVRAHDGPVALSDLYRAFASHPKARANRNYQAKLRQVLQLGPFERLGPGVWAAADGRAS